MSPRLGHYFTIVVGENRRFTNSKGFRLSSVSLGRLLYIPKPVETPRGWSMQPLGGESSQSETIQGETYPQTTQPLVDRWTSIVGTHWMLRFIVTAVGNFISIILHPPSSHFPAKFVRLALLLPQFGDSPTNETHGGTLLKTWKFSTKLFRVTQELSWMVRFVQVF